MRSRLTRGFSTRTKEPVSPEYHRRKFDWIGEKLGIKESSDWYRISGNDVSNSGGHTLLQTHYKGSLYSALTTVYPEFKWNPLLFKTVPQRSWKSQKNKRELLDWIGEQLNIEYQSDWYNTTGEDIKLLGGSTLINCHNSSWYWTLCSVYPEFEWNPLLLKSVPHTIPKENLRELLDWIADQVGIETQEDWHNVLINDIKAVGGSLVLRLLKEPDDTLFEVLQKVYPEFQWNPLNFFSKYSRYWSNINNQRVAMDWIADALGVWTQSEWYSVHHREIRALGGFGILKQYNKSVISLLRSVYPEFEWDNKFVKKSDVGKKQRHRELFDKVAKRLGIQKQEDWYYVTVKQFQKIQKTVLSNNYNTSLFSALKYVYPEYEWNESMLHSVRKKDVVDRRLKNHRKIFDKIAMKLNIRSHDDWYSVTGTMVMKHGGECIMGAHYNNSLFNALQTIYPEYEWNPLRCRAPPRNYLNIVAQDVLRESLDKVMESETPVKSSRLLSHLAKKFGGKLKALEMVYPEIAWRAMFHASSGENLLEHALVSVAASPFKKQQIVHGYSVDFYIPQLGVAIEFQGGQHYRPIYRGSILTQKERDKRKRLHLQQMGITVVDVPYWWHGNIESLTATLLRTSPRFEQLQ